MTYARTLPHFGTPTLEQIGKSLIADHLNRVAALQEPYPCTVTLPHFIKRDLGAAIEAGRCTVTASAKWFLTKNDLIIIDVVRLMDKPNHYILIDINGNERHTYSGLSTLAVAWHDFGDTWEKLSPVMRLALRHLAGDVDHKPRWNTLRGLDSRGLIADGQLTPFALDLYRQHKPEFEHGTN
ncbi:MAG: hypothetical protein ABI690_13630 [Chloroflexota bacterium]